ncbi:hypothetical protein HJY40_004194 [Escherichia coli]|nr:hypothetical protein [Escherichia coli]EFW5325534.1 hypothetical protein [Escherichia coli]
MTLKRACSLLTVKSFSEDERVITGIASTPSPDRDGDILEPEGAEYSAAIFLIPICISFDTAEKRRYATYLILNRRFSFEF